MNIPDLTDAELQAAIDGVGYPWTPDDVRSCCPSAAPIIALARALKREAELRAKYEPEPVVDPVLLEARMIAAKVLNDMGASDEQIAAGDIAAGLRDDAIIVHAVLTAIRRGMEMQADKPIFTHEEAERIAWRIAGRTLCSTIVRHAVVKVLTTPRAELAKMGEG